MNIQDKLASQGLTLPEVSTPGGAYVSVNVRNSIAYIAIQFPIKDGDFYYQGRLGKDLDTEDGYKATQMCALNVLAQIDAKVGFENVEGINHMDAYFQSGDDWDESPKVVDGASDLFKSVLEEKGVHSRAIFGVEKLPRNFCVGITVTVSLKK